MKLLLLKIVFLIYGLVISHSAVANFVITPTRVIYNEKDNQNSVFIINKGKTPILVQAWIDNGDLITVPDNATAPFVVLPPIFRLEPQTPQNIKIIFNQTPVESAIETLYWLNILEIPSTTKGNMSGQDHMSMAIRLQMKVIYRPDSIKDKSKWPASPLLCEVKDQFVCKNQTPYFITANEVSLKSTITQEKMPIFTQLFAPFEEKNYPLSEAIKKSNAYEILYTQIDDEGEIKTHKHYIK